MLLHFYRCLERPTPQKANPKSFEPSEFKTLRNPQTLRLETSSPERALNTKRINPETPRAFNSRPQTIKTD
eukprot:1460412-Amphidinium_carterae.1